MTTLLFVMFNLVLPMNQYAVTKTLVNSFKYNNEKSIELDLPGEVALEEWDQNHIRIQIHIEMPEQQKRILKTLIVGGRYSVKAATIGDILRLSIPRKDFTISGYSIEERISFTVQAPRYVQVVKYGQTKTTALTE